MDEKVMAKFEMFWNLYNKEDIPDKNTLNEEDKKAFVEYMQIHEDIEQKLRIEEYEHSPGKTISEIEDSIKDDIDSGFIDDLVLEELELKYPELSDFFDARYMGKI